MDFWLTITGMWYSVLNMSAASSLLAQLFGVYGLVVGSVLILQKNPPKREAIKLLGSAFVLALAFAANSSWTYALAIFVVATLVTELEFLEKLAAMFTNNGQHLATLMGRDRDGADSAVSRAASEAEAMEVESAGSGINSSAMPSAPEDRDSIEATDPEDSQDQTKKAEENLSAEEPGRKKQPTVERSDSVQNHRRNIGLRAREARLKRYYDSVRHALVAEDGPFPGGEVTSDLVFATNSRKQYADFVVHFHGKVYVVNAKQTVNMLNLVDVIEATIHAALLYSSIKSVKAEPLLVLPSQLRNSPRYARQVQILFYNESLHKFV